MADRQSPEMIQDDYDLPHRRWRAWGICTAGGELAEVTADVVKAQVWMQGGHHVIAFVHDEPIEPSTLVDEPKLL